MLPIAPSRVEILRDHHMERHKSNAPMAKGGGIESQSGVDHRTLNGFWAFNWLDAGLGRSQCLR